MTTGQALAAEIEQESQATRNYLDRIPDAKLDLKCHDKSFSICGVASHIAETFTWAPAMIDQDVFDMDPSQFTPWQAASKQELLDTFDKNLAAALDQVRAADDAKMSQPWTMKVNGQTAMEAPRAAVLRMMFVNHIVHHRAQLGVYLRLADVAVPQAYGPTADEPEFN